MNDENNKSKEGSEPLFEPLIRCEATFHPAPGYEYLNEVPHGECEPCPIESVISVQMELKDVKPDGSGKDPQ